MAIRYDRLMSWPFEDVEHCYGVKDTMLYALGLGAGNDPLDRDELRYVYEDGLLALPTLAVVLAYPGFWLRHPDTGIDWVRYLHAEQGLEIHRPLPAEGTVTARTRVTDVIDKGADKGALIYTERVIRDRESGLPLATVRSTGFARGDGGFSGEIQESPAPPPVPAREPEQTLDLAISPRAALIYRLSGDFNPLHADPDVARAAGFDAPILHGLCTFGMAGRALVTACCEGDPHRLTGIRARFSAPVYPGETLRIEIWPSEEPQADAVSFRAKVTDRDAVVLNNGLATIRGTSR